MTDDVLVHPDGRVEFSGHRWRCTLGRGGCRPAADKREGDGATPIGRWPLRWGYWRPDRLVRPNTRLPFTPLHPQQGWCDDPASPAYNRPVSLPFGASHEKLWRDDAVYDVIVVLGHNDAPPQSGMGSAIFLHVARPDFAPTEGCVAMALPDLLHLLAQLRPGVFMRIEGV